MGIFTRARSTCRFVLNGSGQSVFKRRFEPNYCAPSCRTCTIFGISQMQNDNLVDIDFSLAVKLLVRTHERELLQLQKLAHSIEEPHAPQPPCCEPVAPPAPLSLDCPSISQLCELSAQVEDVKIRNTLSAERSPNGRVSTTGPDSFVTKARVSVTNVAREIVNSQRPLEERILTDRSQSTLDFEALNEGQRRNNAMRRALHHPVFELAMGIAVSSNSIFIGLEIEYMTAHPDDLIPPFGFTFISYVYTTVFCLELLLRLMADWWGFLWDSNAKSLAWNYLDIVIVCSSLVEVVLDIISFQNATSGNEVDLSTLRVIRMIRVFRLIRLLRIARFVRFVRALRLLVFSIACTLKSVFWAMVLMVVVIYVFAILFTQATVSYKTIESLSPTIPNLELYWGTIGSSMFSLFMSISGGISWVEVVEPLNEISIIWKLLFTVYIYFTYFAMLNVITGIFCQAALESCSEDHDSMLQTVLRHKQLYTMRFMEIFKEIDEDSSGMITLDEFVARMDEDDVKDYFASLELNCADALCLFDLFEDAETENGGIKVDEFVMGCLRLKGTARSSDMVRLLHENRQLLDHLDRILDHFKISSAKKEETAVTVGILQELTATQSQKSQ